MNVYDQAHSMMRADVYKIIGEVSDFGIDQMGGNLNV